MSEICGNVSIVLCNTSHPGNIGATARAMKTMGIKRLILVDPKCTIDDHAIALASNAADVVQSALIVNDLHTALCEATLTIALSARRRELQQQIYTPREIMPAVIKEITHNEKIAFVFGCETSGLTISQLEACNRLVTIPGNKEYFSLNLAQAVQIICYELYTQLMVQLDQLEPHNKSDRVKPANVKLATHDDIYGTLNELDLILSICDYYAKKNQKLTMRNLQHILHKASLERHEIDLLRGILNTITKKLRQV